MAPKPSAARTSDPRDIVPVASTSRASVLSQPNVHTRTVEAALPEDENDCDIVYCDGACKGNGQPGSVAGIGVWWGHGDLRNIFERCPGTQTNNRAELIAIVRILEMTPPLKRRLLIKTDSNYSIQCVTSWIFHWMRNGFLAADGKPVKNRALIKYLAALLDARRKTSQTVEFKHVRGHAGIEGNEAADQLANLGATKPMVPERDWEKLEKQVLESLNPVKPVNVVDDDLKAFADGLLNDDELAELADTSIGKVVMPEREPRRQHSENGKHATRSHASVSPVPHDVSPPRVNAAGSRPSDGTAALCKSVGSSGPPAVTAQWPPSAPSKKPTTVISKEELEQIFASCLLGDDELSSLGKDGVFDSDF
ncbi:ribonuclease H-like domain-containing protein [Boletus coccyginus]|nr:ribonuclease H-like domain-containing protein [Boletus coccyginus]